MINFLNCDSLEYIESILEDVNDVINSESENTNVLTAMSNLKQCKLMMRKNFLLPDLIV
jgi:hypothetical protein